MADRLSALILASSLLFCSTANADWVKNWFDKSNIDSGSSYKNQQRGFYSAGGFSGRFNTATDHPVTISSPKLASGCGGVDVFMGGVSFLDKDYIVEKFENMLQVAPALAFDMALKTMCKECSETLVKLDAAATWLNGLQLNECAMSKRMVVTASKGDPNIMGAVWNEISSGVSLKESTDRSWQEAQERARANDNKPTVDLKKQIVGCSVEITEIFKSGSVIEHAANKVGMSEYADIIRGYMGDVRIQAGETDFIPMATEISSCPQNQKTSLEDMLYGHAYAKDATGACSIDSKQGVMSIVREKLTKIANHMKENTALTEDEEKFINATNVPVYSILRKAVIKGNVDLQIDIMSELVAVNYTLYIFGDLYRNTEFMFNKVKVAMETPNAVSGDKPCDMRVYQQASVHFDNLHARLRANRREILSAYHQKLNALAVSMQFQHLNEQEDQRMNLNSTLDYGRE